MVVPSLSLDRADNTQLFVPEHCGTIPIALMGLIEFLDNFPESEDQPLSYAALSQLSGISRPEATELALTWEEWTEARRLELIERLTGLQEDHNDLEFEVVFKEGLRLDDPRGRVLSLLGLSESHDRTLIAMFVSILRE